MRNFLNKSAFVAALVLVFTVVVSCEKDFKDIGSGIINNTKFTTESLLVDVEIENSPITEVTTGNITSEPGTYLLGVHASDKYEKIEASIISQLAINTGFKLVSKSYGADTTVVTTIDTVFLRLPYQVTLNEEGSAYDLDSIIGNTSEAFNLNVYQTDTYLNRLNPADPTKFNTFSSKDVFGKTGDELNKDIDFKFIPKASDTTIVIKRWLSDNTLHTKDTVKYTSSSSSKTPIPFMVVPLKEDKIKELFLDKYESAEFDSQDAFNNYFRGVILEAKGDKGSLISFNFNGATKPSIEVYYTNTVLTKGAIIDTITKNDSYTLSGVRTSSYKMEEKVYPVNNEVILQGAAGNEAIINLFDKTKIEELRNRNLLINDASLTVYINQSADTTATPFRLFLYKSDEKLNPTYSQVKDVYTEGNAVFGGVLTRDSKGKQEKYTFKITDYISDILGGDTDYSPALRLKVANATDLVAVTDTVYNNFNWNPKAVTLFNQLPSNGDKKIELKISFSEIKK